MARQGFLKALQQANWHSEQMLMHRPQGDRHHGHDDPLSHSCCQAVKDRWLQTKVPIERHPKSARSEPVPANWGPLQQDIPYRPTDHPEQEAWESVARKFAVGVTADPLNFMTGNPDVALQGTRERVENFFEELAGYAKPLLQDGSGEISSLDDQLTRASEQMSRLDARLSSEEIRQIEAASRT